MRNLNPYDDDTTTFFDNVVAARRPSDKDPDFVTRVVSYRPGIIIAYTAYDGHIATQSLMTAVAVGHVNPTKADLIELYKYKAKIFQNLKVKLTTDENNRLINTCQNCTINAVNSFDHVLPKDEFPEFAVNPKNLFPSCTECNGYKSTIWRNGTNALFLNLFLDILPPEQYLFAEVTVNGNDIDVKYTIENRNGTDAILFNIIQSHYNRLHLPKRFSENYEDVITELINSILSVKGKLSKAEIKETSIEKAERDLNKFGYNYWKAITTIALLNSDDFFEYALEQED